MQTVIMWILALGAVIGGIDHLLGDRTCLGKRFEEGFQLLGPTALSMAGILCLVPLLAAKFTGGITGAPL
ncbi:MAG: ethanolamine utilization protein EutH [Lachnospiraceae bacterium]|nr:ethanolamine utilization protein EutH [Lachnospiraceae bacterium]